MDNDQQFWKFLQIFIDKGDMITVSMGNQHGYKGTVYKGADYFQRQCSINSYLSSALHAGEDELEIVIVTALK